MKNKLSSFVLLNFLLLLYSFCAVLGKKAGEYPLFSKMFIVYYICSLVLLFIFSLGWQQVIKTLPLSVAYSNKALIVVWGVIWGNVFFGEKISSMQFLGLCFVIVGVIIYAFSENGGNNIKNKRGNNYE